MKSVGCIAGENIIASADFPSRTLSLMDGFASRHEWLEKASKKTPVTLKRSQRSVSKRVFEKDVAISARLFEPLPEGFDVVFGEEEVSVSHQTITIEKPFQKWTNVLPAGSKIRKGRVLLSKGSEITCLDIGTASFLELESLPVIRKPRVALIFVCPSIQNVRDRETLVKYLKGISNTIAAQVIKYRGLVRRYKILSDFSGADRVTISRALKNDLIIFIGECSKRYQDILIGVLEKKNVQFHLHTQNVYPGLFFSFGTFEDRLIFLLPNDPIGAILNFEEFVRPALFKMRGKKQITHDVINARLDKTINKSENRISLVQASVHLRNGVFYAVPVEENPFSNPENRRKVNGIIVLPQNVRQLPRGSVTRVQILRQPDWND